MKLEKDWYKSDWAKLLFAVLLNLAFLALMLLCFEVRYEENDDLTVQKFLDGQTAVKTPFVIYINYFLALLIKGAYDLCGNAVPVFSLFQYLLLLTGFTGISYLLFKRLGLFPATVASLALLCFFGADSYLIMTYTKTAGLATVAGVSLMLLAMKEKGGLKKWLPLILGAALVLLSLMLRDKEFAACAALMVPLGLHGLVRHVRSAPASKLRAALGYAAPFLIILVLCGGLFAANAYIWDNSTYRDYKVYNAARSRFVDYNIPDYEQMPEVYDELDIDENTLRLFNFYDTKKWSASVFDTLTEARAERQARPSLGECLGIFLNQCLGCFFLQRHIYGLLAVLLLWLCCGRRDWRACLTIGGAFALFGLLYLSLIYQGRYLVNRTDAGFFFALAVTLLWFISREKAGEERIFCAVLLLLCLGWSYRQNRDTCYWYGENILGDDSAAKAAIEQLLDDEHLFLTEIGGVDHMLYSPLETVPAGYSDKLILLGDWCVEHPNIAATLAKYGIENPYEDIVDNEQAYLIAYDIELSMAYINKYYNPDAVAERVEPLSGSTGLEIYRILGGQ